MAVREQTTSSDSEQKRVRVLPVGRTPTTMAAYSVKPG